MFFFILEGGVEVVQTASQRAMREWLPGTPSCRLLYIPNICSYLKISLLPSLFPLGVLAQLFCRRFEATYCFPLQSRR